MDSLRIGRSLRALRIRRGWRQADVAAVAGIARSKYSRIERGLLRGIPMSDVDAACRALGADLDVRVRWHGEGLDRLLDAAHAGLVNRVVAQLTRYGWATAVEVTFNHFGERGSVDVLAWRPTIRALLIVEVKSVVPDAQAMISAHDRKTRLGEVIGRPRGWVPLVVGKLLVIAEGSTTRRRVLALADLFGAAYPDRATEVRRWLRHPVGPLAGLLFVPSHGPGTSGRAQARERVRRANPPRKAG